MIDWNTDRILPVAGKISRPLCDSCLGRQFANVGHGMSNVERGSILRKSLGIAEVEPDECWLCEGIMGELENFSSMIVEAMDGYEYDTL